jgi:glucosamine kinase
MRLIVDAGASKCHWALIENKNLIWEYESIGINPMFQSDDLIHEVIESFISTQNLFNSTLEDIIYFGAGCGQAKMQERMKNLFLKFFPKAKHIEIHSDLLGAAIASCKDKEGISCILGSGSNACFFDGKQIQQALPSLGYLLGDEGSGFSIGKDIIKAYAYEQMPEYLREDFRRSYSKELSQIIREIYQESRPNKYLASFCLFAKKHQTEPWIHSLISSHFSAFLQIHILPLKSKYPEAELHFSGSVAWQFQEILQSNVKVLNFNICSITQKPLSGLLEYYLI